jgi:aldehyde:ferredoxin oxidoreductase
MKIYFIGDPMLVSGYRLSGVDVIQVTSPEEMVTLGERVFTLLKVYNIRQGVTRKDDTVPDRFFEEPMPEGPARGAILSRAAIDALLDEYYGLRGWDQETGMPSHRKLVELGLEWVDKLLT